MKVLKTVKTVAAGVALAALATVPALAENATVTGPDVSGVDFGLLQTVSSALFGKAWPVVLGIGAIGFAWHWIATAPKKAKSAA